MSLPGPEHYRSVLEKRAAGGGSFVSRAFRTFGDAVKKQFSRKSWGEAAGSVADMARRPAATLRKGLADYKTPLGALGLAAGGYEAYDIVKGRMGPSKAERQVVERDFGKGSGKAYAELSRQREEAEKGSTSARAGGLIGAELGGLASVARGVPFLPAAALTIGSAIAGAGIGRAVDRLRGKKPFTPEQASQVIGQHEAVRRYVRQRVARPQPVVTPSGTPRRPTVRKAG